MIQAVQVGCRMTTARILLIDDDVDLLDMLRMYLERDGFSVTATDVAATGVAAALSTVHDLKSPEWRSARGLSPVAKKLTYPDR